MNLPNKISTLRLLLIPVFAVLFYVDFTGHYIVAACVFALAAFTDFLDGYIARKYDLVTDLGKFLDSSADKVLVLAALVFILDADLFPIGVLGGALTALILAREIMISCLRMIAAAKKVVIAADKLGKVKTVLQDVALVVLIMAGGTDAAWLKWVGAAILGASVVMAVVSGVHYVIKYRFILTGKTEGDAENK